MRRPIGEVLRTWLMLLLPALRIGVRRARRFRSTRHRVDVGPVQGDTPHGSVSFELGPRRPVRLAGHTVGEVTTHDDAGTSTAESVLSWTVDSPAASVVAVLTVLADASFERGNHRAAVWACEEQSVVIEALPNAGFRLEGAGSPPWGDVRQWTLWARLSTDPPVT
ncbi:hypothetical protein [Aeromicrobium sp. CF3.5]|uniref:hypothetical protein n=1 Tax=Aeromicrobium sp. CF3.5 TaxID=3373078 RepID=UPI003EE7BC97